MSQLMLLRLLLTLVVKCTLPPSTSARRMRIDGDLKRLLVEETLKKRARTLQENAAVLEIAQGNPGNVRRWVIESLTTCVPSQPLLADTLSIHRRL
eukprot:5154491-Amphidinium_carterae.2